MKKFNFSPINWKISLAFFSVAAMYCCSLFEIPFPDGIAALVGLSVGYMFRDPATIGWRGAMALMMFFLTLLIWIIHRQVFQDALLGMAFGNLYKTEQKSDEIQARRAKPIEQNQNGN